ncbi:ABC transporter permease subunit [Nocardioides sp. KIGAM211]|uniref:ABC transporter permease subunit n=1 Tax=Nocardioides luti TaxID=2761101 RepID=A0A7X0VAU6_9ACTN|nr:ABC transporter permease subunit [Nocardioides luti]MBB6628154.1 ABC transporter permease subunit [Nocardioides luti]
MSTLVSPVAAEPRTGTAAPAVVRRPIPLSRIVAVEARKSFDTRSGFWLLASIGITALLATGAVLLWAPRDQLTFDSFAAAIGVPMSILLPIVAILSVTSEWSQRSGLTTFTLVPHRGRTVLAKGIVAVAIGVVSMVVAMAIGALGNIAGSAIAGVPTVWDDSVVVLLHIVLANVLGLLVGFMLGVVIRNSPGAIVAYFVYSFVVPTLAMVLANSQAWFRDLQPWVDFNFTQTALFDGSLTGEQWAHLGVTGVLWLLAPLTVGVWMLLRSEVK